MVDFKNDERLNTLNHSCAHLMAQAVKHLYPEAKFWVGPVVSEGFYYDIDLGDNVIRDEDIAAIEKEMKKVAKTGKKIIRREISKQEALELFKDDEYKLDLISNLEDGNITDPSRLFVGTIDGFREGNGQVVADIAKRYDAIGGVNGGEFVDGETTWTGMPIGLVMINGEQVNGNSDTVYHVTGITFDNKLVVGNMNAETAKQNNIRDCVSINSSIGPFLIINGEAQDVSGTGGGLNPRTALGQTADGSILLLAIDGRMANSLGASFSDLQDIMLQYGAVNASVMDGGTSTQMYYNGEVINTPYSPTGPRTCPTAWLVK